jgi:VanZ family protein
MKKYKAYIFPVLFCLYLAGVALMCFLHGDKLPDVSGTWFGIPADKAAHIVMFTPFIPLAYLSFRSNGGSRLINLLILTFLLFLGIGTAYITEIIQEKLSYRAYEMKDLIADCIGLASGYGCIALWIITRKSRKRR